MRRGFHFQELVNRLSAGFFLLCGLNAAAQTPDFPGPQTRQPPDSAYRAIRTSLQRAVQTRNTVAEADALQELGLLFFSRSSYARAIGNLLQAQKLFRAANEPDRLARNLNELGTVYYYNRQSALALKQFEEALGVYRRTRNRAGEARTLGNIGHIYEKTGQPDRAFATQHRALATARAAGDSVALAKIYENIASIFEDRAQYDSAYFYYQNALTLTQRTGSELAQVEIINNLGDVFRKTGRYLRGLVLSRQAVAISARYGEKYQLGSAYRDIAKSYRLMNQPDSAYEYIERSRALVDEIYAAENNRQIAFLQTLYEVEQKETEIARLNAQKKQDVLVMAAVSLGLLLVGVLGAVVISRQRLKIRLMNVDLKNQHLEEQALKHRLEQNSQALSAHTLHLIQKNQVLEDLRTNLTGILKDDRRDQRRQVKQVVQSIGQSFGQDRHWEDFRASFEQVHPHFFNALTRQFPDLSAADLRLVALLKMNVASADVATLLGIAPDSLRVARYRLRKKLKLGEGESLTAFVQRVQ